MEVLGIDIGGTSIKCVVTNENGQILLSRKVNTEAKLGREHIIEKLGRLIKQVIFLHHDLSGIGIGTAGRVNTETGTIIFATDNLKDWQGVKLKAIIQSTFALPVFVDNDANAALAGEQWLGSGRNLKDITMLTLGTGVGGANMIDGKILRGKNWSSGEWGHVILVPNGLACNCGQKGCVEQYLSGTSLIRLAERVTKRKYSSGIEIMEDFDQGRYDIVPVVEEYISHLAILILNITNAINPQTIIIGGGVVESRQIWWRLFEDKLSQTKIKFDVKPATLRNMAGSIGAAKLILNKIMNTE